MQSRFVLSAVLVAVGVAVGWLAGTTGRLTETLAQDKKPEPARPAPAGGEDRNAEPEGPRPLETLDWLVGDWVAVGEDVTVEFSCKFTKNKSFLIRSFRTFKKDGVEMSGMQVIGWDPAKKNIRSWTYDSAGGFGEESWTQVDNRYTIRSKYTLPDGGTGSAVNVLTFVNDDACLWKSVNREIDGEFQPDSAQIVIVRAADDEDDAKPSTTKKEEK